MLCPGSMEGVIRTREPGKTGFDAAIFLANAGLGRRIVRVSLRHPDLPMNPPGSLIGPASPSQLSAVSKRLLPWLVAVAFFMESLDTTILNTAVPAISTALHVAPLSMKAVLASYTLSLAVFIPSVAGWPTASERAACSHPQLASSLLGRFFAAYRTTFICSSPVVFWRVAAER